MKEDIDIVKRVKNGDREAFSHLVEKYHRHLLNYIYRLVGDEYIVEDIGQEVFLNVYKSLKNFDETRGTPFSAWLFIAARNRCVSELREKVGKKIIPLEEAFGLYTDEQSGEELLIQEEQCSALRSSLEQLPEHFRTVIEKSLRGDSVEEIAQAEGIQPGTVKSRLFRARQRMKDVIREYFGGKGYERI